MDIRDEPFEQFGEWWRDAEETEPRVPDAAALATADAQGRPHVRMVLLKAWGPEGFLFYTNLGSPKAQELRDNPWAELCLHWKARARQVRIAGPVEPLSPEESDAYFATRPRTSRLGAWASRQSEVMPTRHALEQRLAKTVARFPVGAVPRPDFWGGFRLRADRIEFWENRQFRLHVRWVYHRTERGWRGEELYP